MFSQELTTLL